MLKFYKCTSEFIVDGKVWSKWNNRTCLTDKDLKTDVILENGTYEDLWNHDRHLTGSGYYIQQHKKGYLVGNWYNFQDWRSWKKKECPEVGFTIINTYREWSPSLDVVLKWPNGEKAIQYLKERGLAVCPMGGK